MASTTKLAVIVHADVAESTALVQRDEKAAHERIREAFQSFSETMAAYGGATRELRGNALLAEFERASNAVSAALAFQAANAEHNAQLIDAPLDAPRNHHVWTDQYEYSVDEFHAAQDELIRSIVASVQTQITLHEGEVEWDKPRASPSNDSRLKRAWNEIYRGTEPSLKSAVALADEVLAREPGSPVAHQVRAIGLHHLAYLGLVPDWASTVVAANDAAQRAVDLFEADEHSHWILGSTWVLLRQPEWAIGEYERALEIIPNCSLVHGSLGTALASAGKGHEAREANEIAIRSNPRDPLLFLRLFVSALAHFVLGEFAESALTAERCLSRHRKFLVAHVLRLACRGLLDDEAGLEEAWHALRSVFPEAGPPDAHFPFVRERDLDNVAKGLQRAGWTVPGAAS